MVQFNYRHWIGHAILLLALGVIVLITLWIITRPAY